MSFLLPINLCCICLMWAACKVSREKTRIWLRYSSRSHWVGRPTGCRPWRAEEQRRDRGRRSETQTSILGAKHGTVYVHRDPSMTAARSFGGNSNALHLLHIFKFLIRTKGVFSLFLCFPQSILCNTLILKGITITRFPWTIPLTGGGCKCGR